MRRFFKLVVVDFVIAVVKTPVVLQKRAHYVTRGLADERPSRRNENDGNENGEDVDFFDETDSNRNSPRVLVFEENPPRKPGPKSVENPAAEKRDENVVPLIHVIAKLRYGEIHEEEKNDAVGHEIVEHYHFRRKVPSEPAVEKIVEFIRKRRVHFDSLTDDYTVIAARRMRIARVN